MRFPIRRWFPEIGYDEQGITNERGFTHKRGITNEHGITLVELTVGLFVLSLIFLAVTGWMSGWNKNAQTVTSSAQAHMQGETAVRILREDFQSGLAIEGTGRQLVFRDGRNRRIRYSLSENDNLIRSVDGEGASVAAVGVKKWSVARLGENAVQVALAVERLSFRWETEAVLALRRWKYE